MVKFFLEKLEDEGWTQKEVAEKAGISQPAISKLINGGKCNVETLIKLADAFEVSTDEVLGRTNKEKSIKPKD